MQCDDSWQRNSTGHLDLRFGCSEDGGEWKLLDRSMTSSNPIHLSVCSFMCAKENENGCCYLNDIYGCWWKENSSVSMDPDDCAVSITCTYCNILFNMILIRFSLP